MEFNKSFPSTVIVSGRVPIPLPKAKSKTSGFICLYVCVFPHENEMMLMLTPSR